MAGESKGLAGNTDDVTLTQEARGQLGGVSSGACCDGADIREGVERAFGKVALDAGNGAEPGDDAVAKLDVLGTHIGDALLRGGDGGESGLLHDGGGIRGGLALQLLELADDGLGREGKT